MIARPAAIGGDIVNKGQDRRVALGVLTAVLLLGPASEVAGAASWTKLANPAPKGAQTGTMLLLTDGTIMIQNGPSAGWLRLTPDGKGSYINGTWASNPI